MTSCIELTQYYTCFNNSKLESYTLEWNIENTKLVPSSFGGPIGMKANVFYLPFCIKIRSKDMFLFKLALGISVNRNCALQYSYIVHLEH